MYKGVEQVSSWITFSPQTTVAPSTGNSTFFDSSMILHHSCQKIQLIIHTAGNCSSPINVCNILYQLSIKPLIQMCQIMPIQRQDIPPFLISKILPHTYTYTSHDAYLQCRGISHFGAQRALRRRYPEWSVLCQNQVLSRWSPERIWGIAGCSLLFHIAVSFITCSRISSVIHLTSEKQKQQLCNHYYFLNYSAYCSAILFEYTNSRLTNRN
jgi:hypothetical protein